MPWVQHVQLLNLNFMSLEIELLNGIANEANRFSVVREIV